LLICGNSPGLALPTRPLDHGQVTADHFDMEILVAFVLFSLITSLLTFVVGVILSFRRRDRRSEGQVGVISDASPGLNEQAPSGWAD
jgi:predicted permease